MFQANAFQNNAFQITAFVIAIACIHASAIIVYPYIIQAELKISFCSAILSTNILEDVKTISTATASLKQPLAGAELC
jgi:hypothetical protein